MTTLIIDANELGEIETHVFAADASDLGIPIGVWPESLQTRNKLGNGLVFFRTSKKLDADGDIIYVRYRQALGCIDIRVYND